MIPQTRFETRTYYDYSYKLLRWRCLRWWWQSKLYCGVRFYWDKEQHTWCREVSNVRGRAYVSTGAIFADGVTLSMTRFVPEPNQLITCNQVTFDAETTPTNLNPEPL